MQLGIIGFPGAGKTTVFNALTGSQLPTGDWASGGRFEVQTAVVEVPDARLEALSERFSPRKTTHVKVTYADVGGLQAGAGREGLPGPLINQLEQMDGLLHIVRAFEDPDHPHPAGEIDPQRDLQAMETEFLLSDMLVVERRLDRLAEEKQKGARERAMIEREIAFFQKLDEALGEEKPLRRLGLSLEEAGLLTGFGLLSRKPVLVVINIGEGEQGPELGDLGEGMGWISLQGKLEMEIAQLPAEDRKDYLQEFGIQEPGRERVIRASHELLDLTAFFTINEQELRAWTIPRGSTALEAAGTVHSDLARGFIRAEVIAWDMLLELGGLAEARAAGKLRLEGKDYVVADGEVIYIRFNI
jgi:hypothetical protein